MIRIEEALIELGPRPLRYSSYSHVLLAVLNAYLPSRVHLEPSVSGQHALTVIYQLKDEALQERILQKQLGSVRNRDSYRTALLLLSGALASGVVLFAVWETLSHGSPSSGLIRFLIEWSPS